MPLSEIHIAGYRSVRDLRLPLRRLTVLVGGNGVGKTNLYRALQLVQAAALGSLGEEIAREGGLPAVMWAGTRQKGESPRLHLAATMEAVAEEAPAGGHAIDTGFAPQYEIEIGYRIPTAAAFDTEAIVKSEALRVMQRGRPASLMERQGASAWCRDEDGRRLLAHDSLLGGETALSALRGGFPEVDAARGLISSWRFYHGFRTDPDAPLRRPALAVAAPLLAADGGNLAAVFATLRHIREDSTELDAAIEAAFPGARLDVPIPEQHASFTLTFPDLPRRGFAAHELSDGTLHFLALLGALLSYRLPPLIVLNEPEASLHPDLLPAIAGVIATAARRTQILVVTHSNALAAALEAETGAPAREVLRQDGATRIAGLTRLGQFEDE